MVSKITSIKNNPNERISDKIIDLEIDNSKEKVQLFTNLNIT
jgi:predicted nucleic acid-binding OB-fold protein